VTETNMHLTAAVYSVIVLTGNDIFARLTITKLRYILTTSLVEY